MQAVKADLELSLLELQQLAGMLGQWHRKLLAQVDRINQQLAQLREPSQNYTPSSQYGPARRAPRVTVDLASVV
jgi:hypothetical protein